MSERSNEDWLTNLRSTGKAKQGALADLREIILNSLPYALSKYLHPSDPHFDPLIQEVAQETLLQVMDRLETFEGRSKFTTWVYTIAVRIALTELRRLRWKELSLDELQRGEKEDDQIRELPDENVNIAAYAEQNEVMEILQERLKEALTEKQRTALIAIAIHGIPIAEVAMRMGTNRNALYKLLHDARLKLKKDFQERGLDLSNTIASFKK